MKIIVSCIDWDYDGKHDGEPYPEGLPKTVTIKKKDMESLPNKGEVIIENEAVFERLMEDVDGEAENLAEYLTDKYGYCLCGFVTEVES